MSDAAASSLILLGLKGSGKTNFIVGLDVVLDAQAEKDGLVHDGIASDREYLQPLREQWLRGEVLPRTNRQESAPLHQILAKHPPSGVRAGLSIPDFAGELFDSHFVTRSFPSDLCERIQKAKGFLLFLHCKHNADHSLFEDPFFMETDSDAPPPATSLVSWQLEMAARQVKLVDLLQFIEEVRLTQAPARIAVMISAWDVVDRFPSMGKEVSEEIPKDPSEFFSKNWPLLSQFLSNRPTTVEFHVFGVSDGGGGTTKAEIERLTSILRLSERVLIVDGAHRSNDLSRPIRWLLGLLDSTA